MTEDDILPFFTRSDGSYLCARWARPIVPVVFGVDDATLGVVKGAIEAVVLLANHRMSDTDPELGVNLLMFFFRDWDELLETPDLGRLVPDLEPLVGRLKAGEANQYRLFRFEESGAIKAAFVFLRMDDALYGMAVEDLALAQAAEVIILWSDIAFKAKGPLATVGDRVILRPDIASVIRAAYDPTLPVVAEDPTHALRLAARVGQM